MLIIELLILLFAHLWPGIVFLLFIVKDIRLIEDKYWRAAGYQLDKLKKILVVLSLLVIPVILTVGGTIYVWTDILTDPDVLTNPDVLLWILSVPLCILSCAVAEAILLNRGEEKHRALPWGLAAVNALKYMYIDTAQQKATFLSAQLILTVSFPRQSTKRPAGPRTR